MKAKKNEGTSLLEVLIAVVIISVALLGITKLQTIALQNSTQSGIRSSATDLVASLAARMRANVASDNLYISTAINNCNTSPNKVCAMLPDGDISNVDNCSSVEIATFDLWEIRCSSGIKNILPGGSLEITCTDNNTADLDVCSDNSEFHISTAWQTPNGTQNLVMSLSLGGAL